MKYVTLLSMVIFISCSKNEESEMDMINQLLGNWHCYDYKFHDENWSEKTNAGPPYVILNEYGSGFYLSNQEYFTHYSMDPNERGIFRGTWTLVDPMTLSFDPIGAPAERENFHIEIISIGADFLQIRGPKAEFKLSKIL